jgi:Zn-dependent protease with chaperone function
MFGLVIGVVWCLERYSPAYRQSDLSAIVTPLICLAGIVITWLMAPRRKKSEIAADRFAAQITGVETFKRAITRIHDLNGVPHRLDPSTVKILGHPDLATQLKRLDENSGEID